MVRQRRFQINSESNRVDKGANSSSSNGSNSANIKSIKNTNIFTYWKQIIVCIVLAIAICFGYMGYLETRVNTPLDDKKVSRNK